MVWHHDCNGLSYRNFKKRKAQAGIQFLHFEVVHSLLFEIWPISLVFCKLNFLLNSLWFCDLIVLPMPMGQTWVKWTVFETWCFKPVHFAFWLSSSLKNCVHMSGMLKIFHSKANGFMHWCSTDLCSRVLHSCCAQPAHICCSHFSFSANAWLSWLQCECKGSWHHCPEKKHVSLLSCNCSISVKWRWWMTLVFFELKELWNGLTWHHFGSITCSQRVCHGIWHWAWAFLAFESIHKRRTQQLTC